MQKFLAALTILWPLVLASGWWARAEPAPDAWSSIVYTIGGRICHQRPERTFHSHGEPWPVCGRCSGLYLAAPIGAAFALASRRRAVGAPAIALFAAAAMPTVVTLALEWTGAASISSFTRAIAALPLGAATAFLVVSVADRSRS